MNEILLASLISLATTSSAVRSRNAPSNDRWTQDILRRRRIRKGPTPIDLRRPYKTDRPSKTDSPFTIDGGVFQIESDVASWTLDLGVGRSAPSR